jgi:hypothetical protein
MNFHSVLSRSCFAPSRAAWIGSSCLQHCNPRRFSSPCRNYLVWLFLCSHCEVLRYYHLFSKLRTDDESVTLLSLLFEGITSWNLWIDIFLLQVFLLARNQSFGGVDRERSQYPHLSEREG